MLGRREPHLDSDPSRRRLGLRIVRLAEGTGCAANYRANATSGTGICPKVASGADGDDRSSRYEVPIEVQSSQHARLKAGIAALKGRSTVLLAHRCCLAPQLLAPRFDFSPQGEYSQSHETDFPRAAFCDYSRFR